MQSEGIAAKISALENARAACQMRLDDAFARTRAPLAAQAVRWIEAEVKRRVNGQPAIIHAMGQTGIRALKDRLAALYAQMPAVVEAATSDKEQWPHRKVLDGTGKRETVLSVAFRDAIGELGTILDEFGFLSASDKSLGGNWEPTAPGKFRHRITSSTDIDQDSAVIDYYKDMTETLRPLDAKIADTRKQLESAKAQELWDSV